MNATTKEDMKSKFKPGQKCEVREYTTGKWRPAMVIKAAPYPRGNCDGAYIQWQDLPKPCPEYISTGGWAPDNSIHIAEPEYLCEYCGSRLDADENAICGNCAARDQG